jgi:uncharacterized protein (DUF433 family)
MNRPSVNDLRHRPVYSAKEAAQYLRLPGSTVRAWAFGQNYRVNGEIRRQEPVIATADPANRRLSFINLIELLVLAAMRREHKVDMRTVREALSYLRKAHPSDHPLADHVFQTDGVQLFVEKYGAILNISRDGQVEMAELIRRYLRLVERDASGVPFKLHLPRRADSPEPMVAVVIDPLRGFGRPLLDARGIRTEVILDRFHAGESLASLAADYEIDQAVVEDILRSEPARAA